MNVGTNGIVVDQHGNVLLIKRNDTRTFAPPGGALDAGELPPEGVAREVREETGLIVLPVRLAMLTYLPLTPFGFLGFTFRCLLRGGEITTSEESPLVGFFKTTPLPRRMSGFHRERVEKSLSHTVERPLFFQHYISPFNKVARFVLRHVVYRWLDVKRKLQGQPLYQPPPTWEVAAYFLCRNETGATLWHRPHEQASWRLPGGIASGLMAPWETAVHHAQQQIGIQLCPHHLSDVFLGPKDNQLNLIFTAEAAQSAPQADQTTAWFTPNSEPNSLHPLHHQIANNGATNNQPTRFHRLGQ
jgi:ADP-ribose pyrophosphatase YjhB (NUDIX family)